MKLRANIINIKSTKKGTYPGDKSGESIIITSEGSAEKGETSQQYGQAGFISNPPKNVKGIRLRIGSIDICIGAFNYGVAFPEKPGETKIYSTDVEGVEKASQYLDDQGVHTFNDGDKEAARNGDKVTVTIPAGTFIVEVTGGSGSPAVGVLNPTPIDVDGTIKEGTNEVLFP